jgi:hypothetical protein
MQQFLGWGWAGLVAVPGPQELLLLLLLESLRCHLIRPLLLLLLQGVVAVG